VPCRDPYAILALSRRAGRLKDRAKIEHILGRLQASYASAADLYEMAVRDEDGRLRLHWRLIEDRRAWRDAPTHIATKSEPLAGWTRHDLTHAHASDPASERITIDGVAISQHPSRRHLVWKGFNHLLCGPRRRRMLRDVDVDDPPQVVRE
jgi:hypothetical protein